MVEATPIGYAVAMEQSDDGRETFAALCPTLQAPVEGIGS